MPTALTDDDADFDHILGRIKDHEPTIRNRARKLGYQVTRKRGLERKRRETAGLGPYMLLAADAVVLFAATQTELVEFLDSRLHPN
jgi:hypothetical protein